MLAPSSLYGSSVQGKIYTINDVKGPICLEQGDINKFIIK